MPFPILVRIAAPSEGSAWDLAEGGLLIFDPDVISVGGAWHVQLRYETRPAPDLLDALVARWLWRCGLSETVITELGPGSVTSRTVAAKTGRPPDHTPPAGG